MQTLAKDLCTHSLAGMASPSMLSGGDVSNRTHVQAQAHRSGSSRCSSRRVSVAPAPSSTRAPFSKPLHQKLLVGASGTPCHSQPASLHFNRSLAEHSAEAPSAPTAVEDEAMKPDLSNVTEWELDFCSRPLLDERGKRVWELLVCDASRQLQFSEYFPSNRINSATLKDALLRVCDACDAPKPQKIRFFRAQMQTIISKACSELDIQPVPSQRCVTLVRWLEQRLEEVYKKDPSFQSGAAPLLQLEPPPPQDLPDTLRGEQWAFVQLPLSDILQEASRVVEGEMFGSTLSLDAIGLGGLPKDTMVPGVAVMSTRATPLSAWTSALELANLRADTSKACLLLSTGVAETWRYAFYRKSSSSDAEARAWEDAKRACQGLHFLAVQKDLEEEECTGFWMLHDTTPPSF